MWSHLQCVWKCLKNSRNNLLEHQFKMMCLYVMSPCRCLSKSPSKFDIVSMTMVILIDRMDPEPIVRMVQCEHHPLLPYRPFMMEHWRAR